MRFQIGEIMFKKTTPDGKVDPNINIAGRKPKVDGEGNKVLTNREIKSKELLSILRKVKPHLSQSIMTAADIMKNKEATHQNQLKAAVILINAYRELVIDLYGKDVDGSDEGEEIQPTAAFSLKVIGE